MSLSRSFSKIMVPPKRRAEGPEGRWGCIWFLFPSSCVGACPSSCHRIKAAIRFFEVFPSWCCCLGGFGDIHLSPVTCFDVGQVKALEASASLIAVAVAQPGDLGQVGPQSQEAAPCWSFHFRDEFSATQTLVLLFCRLANGDQFRP